MSSFLVTLIPAFDERTTTMAAPDQDGLANGLVSIGEEEERVAGGDRALGPEARARAIRHRRWRPSMRGARDQV